MKIRDMKVENKCTKSCQEIFPLFPHLPPTSCSPSLNFHSLTCFCLPRSVSVDIFQSLCCDKAGSIGSTAIISLALVLRCEVFSYIWYCLAVAWDVKNSTMQIERQTVVTKLREKKPNQKTLLTLLSVCIWVSTPCSVTDISTWLPEDVEAQNVLMASVNVISLSSQGSLGEMTAAQRRRLGVRVQISRLFYLSLYFKNWCHSLGA